MAFAEILHVDNIEYSSIQNAIDDANHGDVIIVEPNIYYENIDFLGLAITLRSEDPNNPSVVAATIIDANNPANPNFGSAVLFRSGETNESVLEGFTIRNGTGSWILVSWEFKGLRWNRCGGGVLCYNMSAPTIRNNVFINNMAGQGGGIYIYGNPVDPNNPSNPPVHVSPVITDNQFIENSAIKDNGFVPPDTNHPENDHGDGGGFVAFQGVDAIVKNNLFEDNFADLYGGAFHLRQWSNGLIEGNQILHNHSSFGPGIHITYSSSPQVLSNNIERNHGGSGAGLYVYYLSAPYIAYNRITNNSAINGAVGVHFNSAGEIKNNLIYNNKDGPAVICTVSSPLISHNTIINNEQCGIQCNQPSTPIIENNIIASTRSGHGINTDGLGNPTIKYNNIWNNGKRNYGPNLANLTGIAGNISIDPEFHKNGAFTGQLDYVSGCINSGDPNFVPDSVETDYEGQGRILKGRTDIGADEAAPVWNLSSNKQYLSIQSAIDDVNYGENILVTKDRYYENLIIDNKSFQLYSEHPNSWDCISDTIIDGNDSDSAVITFSGGEDSNCLLWGFTITGSNHNGSGGAVSGNGTEAILRFCHILNNSAAEGAGLYDFDGLINNCKIFNNDGQFNGGGLQGCDGYIYNCFIGNNHAGLNGGGLYDCSADIINSTIANNAADVNGGGLHTVSGLLKNCIVWDNTAALNPGFYNISTPSYSCLQTPVSGEDNIYTEPQFVDSNNGDYHLTLYSDCIDMADNNAITSILSRDIDSEERPFTFNRNALQLPDIGADEVIASAADFNDNGTVDVNDFAVLTGAWLQTGEGMRADLQKNGFIDFNDYALFSQDWGLDAPWSTDLKASALAFDSNSSGYVWIHTPDGNVLNNVFTFTYTGWIYPTSLNDLNDSILDKHERGLFVGSGGRLVGYTDGGDAYSESETGAVKTGRWQFVTITYDSNSVDKLVRLYVDSEEVSYTVQDTDAEPSNSIPDWTTEGSWDLYIGTSATNPGFNIPEAIIDEIGFYDRVLTESELEYLYHHGYGRPTDNLNPIGLWHFDENSGTILQDSSGNNNDGSREGGSPPSWTDGKFLKY
jgi:hypothetical protein